MFDRFLVRLNVLEAQIVAAAISPQWLTALQVDVNAINALLCDEFISCFNVITAGLTEYIISSVPSVPPLVEFVVGLLRALCSAESDLGLPRTPRVGTELGSGAEFVLSCSAHLYATIILLVVELRDGSTCEY
jgi:hypothetical protein